MRSLPLVPLFLVACGFAGADGSGPPATPDLPSPHATRVETVTLEPSVATVELTLPGEVVGSRDVLLAAGNGGLVESVAVKRGQQVGRGALIAKVDADLYGAQLAQAKAQHAQAAAERDRQVKLGDLSSPAQRQNAETAELVAAAAVQAAQARYDRAAITAPFAGTVADVFLEAGASAPPGTAIARLVMLDPIRVTLSVSDRDVVALEPGMPVHVRTNARGDVFSGTISHIGAAAALNTRAFPVEVQVPNPDHALLPGMIAQVHLERAIAEDAVVVPQDWIVTRRSERGVFVDDGGVARWRDIVLGDVARDQIVVLSGLSPGDRVVITGHRDLADGDPLLVARTGTCCTDGRPTWGE